MSTIKIKVGKKNTGKSITNLQDAYNAGLVGVKSFILDVNEEYNLTSVYSKKTLNDYLLSQKDFKPKSFIPSFINNQSDIMELLEAFVRYLIDYDREHKLIILEDIGRYVMDEKTAKKLSDLLLVNRQNNISYILTFQSFVKAEKYLQYAHSIQIFGTADKLNNKESINYEKMQEAIEIVKNTNEHFGGRYFNLTVDLTN